MSENRIINHHRTTKAKQRT